jgi:hypothetical protein
VLAHVQAQQAAYESRERRFHPARQRPPNNLEAPGLPTKGRPSRADQKRAVGPVGRKQSALIEVPAGTSGVKPATVLAQRKVRSSPCSPCSRPPTQPKRSTAAPDGGALRVAARGSGPPIPRAALRDTPKRPAAPDTHSPPSDISIGEKS